INKYTFLHSVSLTIALLMTDSCLAAETLDEENKTVEEGKTEGSATKAEDTIKLDAMTVVGNKMDSYSAPRTRSASKTDTPTLESPVSIQVVPKSVMEDQKSVRIKDALENVSGVRARSTGNLGTGYIIRGFQTDKTYRNGLIANAGNDAFSAEFDTANIESIEVLKGPASVLYGRSEPGGLVNINIKKPQATPYYSVEQQMGSYDHYRTQWDATNAITDDESLLYRFSGSYQNNNSFRDFVSADRFVLAPSVTWQPTDALDFTVNLEWLDQDYQADFGIPVVGNRPASIPINRSMGDSNDPIDNQRSVHLGSEMNYSFNEDWAVHNRFLASYNHSDMVFLTPAPAHGIALEADNRTFGRSVFAQVSDEETYTTNLDLTGKFEMAGTKHDILIGFDYLRSYTQYQIHGAYYAPTPGLELDILNPSYGIDTAVFNIPRNSEGWNFPTYLADWYGVYFQDHITLWDKLHITGGGRYDWARTGNEWNESFSASDANMKMNPEEGFSPRVGIVYQLNKELSLYGNWTTSFGANNGISATGSSFDPEIGKQFEAGIKSELFDQRLTTTLAYYHLTKENILMPDLSTANPSDKTTIGKARSQGIELDVLGQITDQFSLIGSYAYTDARQIKDDNGNEGNRLTNVPEHSGSLWAKYDFNGYEALDGFSIGVGGVAAGKREGDLENTFQLSGFVRMDAFAAYHLKVGETKVTTQINIRNLLDKDYFESTDLGSNAAPRNSVYIGAPLTAIGSLRIEF
ncbi:MAG: TonB-dependent siderophore receptor, partial [Gammaproteobacteria bacterium]|nr:TonB-dependent siderophore receptor [Gammaproteobacteria bacterium]